jgi:probable HAF family extracellular repeat protein
MKFRNLFVLRVAVILVATLATSRWLAAQVQTEEHSKKEHHHYKLIDLGTLGGPHSYGSVNGDGFQLLNNSGVVASYADLAAPDPNAPNCYVPDCSQAHAFRWKNGVMTDIGALVGITSSASGSINSRGWVTGQSQNGLADPDFNCGGLQCRAVLWKHDQIQDLGTLGGDLSLGIYVNDSGQVIGISNNGVPDPFSVFGVGDQVRTFLWEDGVMRDIGTLGGPDALPGASCSGQPHNVIVGFSFIDSTPNASTGIPTVDPFVWKNGVMTDLGNLGGTIGSGQCANHRGQIIGMSTLAGDVQNHAFFWEGGVMTDLGTLGGDNSEAIWLNEAGDVVGSADLAGPTGKQTHDAVLWRDGKIHDLGTVPGDPCSRGRGLNSRGQVVGGSSDCANFLHAFLWEEGGPMLDLNTVIPPGSGFQLTNAFNINDRGEILAKAAPLGFTPNDDADLGHLVLLVPCDSDDAGCEEHDAATINAAPHSSAPINSVATASPHTPRQQLAAWRTRLARHFRIPVGETPRHQ